MKQLYLFPELEIEEPDTYVAAINSDCKKALQVMVDKGVNVDSIVTDPPYELGFMNMNFDKTGIAHDKELWELCLKVLKPGGHLLAFGGSRTYHRMACAIEDAGFEIRDQIMWIYGQGFPKSLNVSKAIDKMAGAEREVVGKKTGRAASLVSDMRGGKMHTGGTKAGEFDASVITAPATDAAKQWDGWGSALKPAHEPICMARKPLSENTIAENVLRHGTGGINVDGCRIQADGKRPDSISLKKEDIPWEIEQIHSNIFASHAERNARPLTQETKVFSVVGNVGMRDSEKEENAPRDTNITGTGCLDGTKVENISTSLSTEEFGKTLMDQYPEDMKSTTLMKTRETTESKTSNVLPAQAIDHTISENISQKNTTLRQEEFKQKNIVPASVQGRWPSNLIHDGSEEVLDEFAKYGESSSSPIRKDRTLKTNEIYGNYKEDRGGYYQSDKGTAARFFYSAKASKKDRNGSKHPTVKPIALMRYLCRLITPPNGIVLDPFAGTGTTGQAAREEGFHAILIEKDETYLEDILRRIYGKYEET